MSTTIHPAEAIDLSIERILKSGESVAETTSHLVKSIAAGLEKLSGRSDLAPIHAVSPLAPAPMVIPAMRLTEKEAEQVAASGGEQLSLVDAIGVEFSTKRNAVCVHVRSDQRDQKVSAFITGAEFLDYPTLHRRVALDAVIRGLGELASDIEKRAKSLESVGQ